MKEFKSLKEVQHFLKTIPFLNGGGCGISALAMYRWLEKKNKINSKTSFCFLYLDTLMNRDGFDNNINIVKTNQNNSLKNQICVPVHVCLYHNGKYFDSNGEINTNIYWKMHSINLKLLIECINFPTKRLKWSDLYDRIENNTIARRLKITLKDILKEQQIEPTI